MKWYVIEGSSSVAKVGYAEDAELMIVEFKGGSQYKYENVGLAAIEEFLASASKGKYFNKYFRGKDHYPCTKVETGVGSPQGIKV